MRLSELRSLGSVSEERLDAVGISTAEELISIGPVEAYGRLRDRYPTTTWSWLYALHLAVLDMPWELMTDEMRRGWRAEVEAMTAGGDRQKQTVMKVFH